LITIEIKNDQLKMLHKAVQKAGKLFPRELAAAINKVAKQTRTDIGKRIRGVMKIKKADVEKHIRITGVATATKLVGKTSIDEMDRAGLQEFGARHTSVGVTYQISRKGGRKTVVGAFMGPKPGVLAPKLYGGVWIRKGAARKMTKGRHQGRVRQPIRKLYGLSAWGAWKKNDFTEVEVVFIKDKLMNEMDRRIKLNILRAEGLVKS
jgi:hypothetical protein